MRIKELASAVPVSLALAACGQGDSGNVLAPDVNALSPAQIDAALGPENGAIGVNEAESVNGTTGDAVATESAAASARPRPAPPPSEAPEAEPADDSAVEPATSNDSAEPPE